MRTTRSGSALVAAVVACAVVLVPSAAEATPTYLTTQLSPFGDDTVPTISGDNISEYGAPVEMAPDGTVLAGRAITGDITEVAVKRPGQDFVRTTLVPATSPGSSGVRLVLATGPGGALAAVYNSGSNALRAVLQPAGSSTWTAPIVVPGGYTGLGSVAFGPDGRLWVVAPDLVSGVSVTRVQVVPASGVGPVLSTTVPSPAVGFDTLPRLVVGADGVGHLASQREVRTQDTATCSFASSVVTADFSAGDATATTVVRAAYQRSGTVSGGNCSLSTTAAGDEVSQRLQEAVDPDGGVSVVYVVTHYGPGGTSATLAVHRDPAGAWATMPETVRAGASYFSGAGLFRLGGSTAALLNGGGGTTLHTRTAAGTWTSTSLTFGSYLVASGSTTGAAVFAYTDGISPYASHARSIAPDGTVSPPVDLGSVGGLLRAVSDSDGNAVVAFRSSGKVVKLLRFDASGPRLSTAGFPTTAVPGQVLTFTADDVDVWSGPAATPTWTFDDGGTATGKQVTHAFATAGAHTLTVTSSDQLGTVAKRTATVTVAAPTPPTPPAPPRDSVAPVVTAARVTPTKPTTKKPGTLAFTSSESGTATVTLTGTAKGVRKGKKCVAPGKVAGKKCTRALSPKTVSVPATGAAQSLVLPTVPAGSWTATVVVADAAGNRGQTTTTFAVKAARKARRAAKKA